MCVMSICVSARGLIPFFPPPARVLISAILPSHILLPVFRFWEMSSYCFSTRADGGAGPLARVWHAAMAGK